MGGDYRAEFSDYGSVAASVIDQAQVQRETYSDLHSYFDFCILPQHEAPVNPHKKQHPAAHDHSLANPSSADVGP